MSKEQLTHIRELIKQKRYNEAREGLQHLVDLGNPTAQKWLAKLNTIDPPKALTPQFTYNADRLEEIRKSKETKLAEQEHTQKQRRNIGCLFRGCLLMVIMGLVVFLMLPMIFAASITSGNPEMQSATGAVFDFVEEQQENPIGRTVTNMYTQTSGRAMTTVLEPRQEEICDVAIQRAAQNGRNVSQAECQRTFNEAMTCVTDRFDEAESCLRTYMFNRCVEQAGNSQQGRAFCNDFVEQHMGP